MVEPVEDTGFKLNMHTLFYRDTQKLSFQELLLMQQNQPDLYEEHKDDIDAYIDANNLGEEYERARAVFNDEIPLNDDLVTALEADEIDFDAVMAAGFDSLKDIENARPDLIVKLQTQLEEQGLYVSDPDHKFYRDGKIGNEESSITWNGIKLAAENGLDYAKDNLAEKMETDVDNENNRMHLQQAANRLNTEAGLDTIAVNGDYSAEMAQEILDEITENPDNLDTIGNMAARTLDKNFDAEFLDSLTEGNENAQSALEHVRNTTFYSGSFDYDSAQASARTLLDYIGHYESGNRNVIYDGGNGTEVDIANMTIDEVLAFQDNHVAQGYASTAISPLQFIRATLRSTVGNVPEVDGNDLMTPEVVERLGIELLEKRGLSRYLEGELGTDGFIYNLSQEWASLPKDEGGRSYYAGDGLNAAHADFAELREILVDMRDNYGQEMEMKNSSDLQVAWSGAGQTPENSDIIEQDVTRDNHLRPDTFSIN